MPQKISYTKNLNDLNELLKKYLKLALKSQSHFSFFKDIKLFWV